MDGRILQRVPTNGFGVVSMSRAFRADKERQVYMGEATHRKPTANKPKQGDMKMKTETETPKYNNAQIAMIENALDLAITELKELRKQMVASKERIALANKALHSRPHTNNGSDLAYMICNAIDALEVVE